MKTERFEMRLDEVMANRIDLWKDSQRDQPSRAEAVRRLLDIGLSVANPGEVSLSNSEKLMTFMLSEVLKNTGGSAEVDPDFIEDVIVGGHYWALSWTMQGIIHDSVDAPSNVREVVDILDMWSLVESAVEDLSDEQRRELRENTSLYFLEFSGFDENNETEHMGIATFMIHKLNRFQRFKNHETGLNSHYPMLDHYRSMLKEFSSIRPSLVGRKLSFEELKVILSR